MRNFLEFIESLAADALCGRGRAVKFGIFLFKRDKLIEKLIVFIIRNLRRILDIVKIRMMREQLAKLVYAALCRVFSLSISSSVWVTERVFVYFVRL